MYTRKMRRSSSAIALMASVSLVALQLSGVHMHIDEHGYVGVPEGPHAHSRVSRDEDVAAGHYHEVSHRHDAHEVPVAHEHAHVAAAPERAAAHSHSHATNNGPSASTRVGTDGDESPAHDHDYDGTKDVSIIELSNGVSKLLLAVFWVAFALPVLFLQYAGISAGQWLPVLGGRRSRWRPPLRAPPLAV